MDLPPRCDAPPALVVVAGQSNALGYTLSRADLPRRLRGPMPAVWIWEASKERFSPMTPGENTGSPNNPHAWGPEAQFAWRWRASSCAPLYIVKYARGETGLTPDEARLDWSPGSAGELFDAASSQISAAKAALADKGLAPRLQALLWMQGETDASDKAKAAAYELNLKSFITQVRARWGDARTIVHIGQIDRLGQGYPGWPQVRRAQARVAAADSHATLVDTDPFPRQSADGLHLTAAAQVRLGDGFFEAQLAKAP